MISNKELKKYFKHVKSDLKYSINVKSQIIKSLKSQVYNYIEENECDSILEIEKEFGTGLTISENLKEEELKYFKKKAKIALIFEVFTIIIAIFLILYIIILLNTLGDSSHITIKKE